MVRVFLILGNNIRSLFCIHFSISSCILLTHSPFFPYFDRNKQFFFRFRPKIDILSLTKLCLRQTIAIWWLNVEKRCRNVSRSKFWKDWLLQLIWMVVRLSFGISNHWQIDILLKLLSIIYCDGNLNLMTDSNCLIILRDINPWPNKLSQPTEWFWRMQVTSAHELVDRPFWIKYTKKCSSKALQLSSIIWKSKQEWLSAFGFVIPSICHLPIWTSVLLRAIKLCWAIFYCHPHRGFVARVFFLLVNIGDRVVAQ